MEQSATSERSELNNETRFTSPISRKRRSVLIGLSGGVDSALAAYLLKKQGYNVKAVFLKMFSAKKSKLFPKCNWLSDYKAAQKVAHNLEIPLTKIDFEKVYRSQVLEPMFKAYSKGLTPNPDIACNTIIKFPMLWKLAKKLSCNYIATGHYAQIKKDSKGFHLLAGKDKTKDQSYFLS
jgi:tRNA-specific 2-thiouridylase